VIGRVFRAARVAHRLRLFDRDGYPIRLPLFGPAFVLEPEAQTVWQQVSFDDANDGLGDVALGTTSGASGWIGLRGRSAPIGSGWS
jgi:hypothetical protein